MRSFGKAGIYVITEDGELMTLNEQPYDTEDLLQELLAAHPSILAGEEISPDSPRRWLLIQREAEIPDSDRGAGRWSLDHVFVDQDGIPTLVEVKRSVDTRIRREVVGQMLDYAANAMSYWSIDVLRDSFEATCRDAERDSEQVLRDFVAPGEDPSDFWGKVKTNLQAGRLRLLFVGDEIPRELRSIVEFLNEQMDPAEVLAIEIKQYKNASLKTLVPRVIGQTSGAEARKGGSRRRRRDWDEASFFEELARHVTDPDVQVARELYDWAVQNTHRLSFGTGHSMGSVFPVVDHRHWHAPFALWTNGIVELQFQWEANKPPFQDAERRAELWRRFNDIPGVSLPAGSLNKRPGIRFSELRSPEAREAFFDVARWFLREVERDG